MNEQRNNLAAQVQDSINKAKRESAKGQLKKLFNEYNEAQLVSSGILNKIMEVLDKAGETMSEKELVEMLQGND